MVTFNTFRFEKDPAQNTGTVYDLVQAFQEEHPGRMVAITHEIREIQGEVVARVRFSLIPLMDQHSADKPNLDLGTVQVSVEQALTAAQLFAQVNETLAVLKQMEAA